MIIKKRKRTPSRRTPRNKNIPVIRGKKSSTEILKRYKMQLLKRNPRTIIFTAGFLLVFIVLPIVLIGALSGPKEVPASAADTPETQMADVTTPSPAPTATPVPTTNPTPVPTPTPIRLAYGDDSATVADIQERLMVLGYIDGAEPTEHFGSVTRAGVKLFERQLGQKQLGVVDDDLYDTLMSNAAEKYMIYLEAQGDDVKDVQERLYQMGYLADKSNTTGYFGDITKDAVLSFQEKNDITADGKVGRHTLEALYSTDAKPNILSYGEKNDIVLKYQQRLKDLAYLTTEPDGTYGKDTLAGIKLFQDKNGLISDGYLGPATKDLLDSSEAPPNALTIGDSGDTITKVQKRLVEANCLKSSSTTGYYGSITEAAVRLFQKTNNLAVDGKVGKQTITLLMSDDFKKALNPISTSDGDGSSSSSGDNVVAAPSKDKIADMLAIARSKLGSPYVRGAKGPNEFDCSGFVYWVLNKAGIKQSYMTSYGWRTTSKYKKITDINALKAGDIIVFHMYGLSSTSGHMGIVSSNTNMVHAISEGVIETSYKQTYWKSRFVSAYRIF